MRSRNSRIVLVVLAIVLVLGLALTLRREAPRGPTGQWIAAAGLMERFETVDGVRLRYVRAGRGPSVVLLHGFASSIVTWRDTLPALARRRHVVAVDLPSFGGSDIRLDLSPSDYPRLVLGLMDRVGIPRATLVGNSMGGGTAIVLAARHPERVERLVLIDSVGFKHDKGRPFVFRVTAWKPATRILEALPIRRAMVAAGLRQSFHDDRLVTDERIDEYVAPLLRKGAVAAAQGVLASGEVLSIPERAAEVRVPTLVIWGREDALLPVALADSFVNAIPGARKVVIEGCGHLPQEERPAELAALLEEFLSSR
jgi:pimeloyl-ACP methyl ester carboxylesterase